MEKSTEKKKITLPIKVVIIGCLIGVLVAGIGGIKQINAKKTNEDRRQAALKESQEKADAAKVRLAEIEKELPPLQEKKDAKLAECTSLSMDDPNWFTNSTSCNNEVSKLQTQISELDSEKFELENADYTVYYQLVEPMSYQIFYIIGACIAGAAILGAFIIYLVKGKKTY